jgi:hypothetical protein
MAKKRTPGKVAVDQVRQFDAIFDSDSMLHNNNRSTNARNSLSQSGTGMALVSNRRFFTIWYTQSS